MDEMLKVWATTFDRSPQPFGVAEVLLDEAGQPYDAVYRYLNPAMAAITGHTADDLTGVGMYTIWGGDPIWLDHFYEAAYEGRSVEFETLSDMLQQFFRAEVFPVGEGLCGLTLQDVTSWLVPAQRALDKASAGLFFYDMRYRQMLLTDSAREQSGIDVDFISLEEFIERTFGPAAGDELRRRMENFRDDQASLYQEGRLSDGRWLRISLDHTGRSERFAYGFLEDFTRTKHAEQRSEQYVEVIDSLGAENFALYLVDLDTNEMEIYRRGENDTAEFALASEREGNYPEAMARYIDTFVVEEDRARVRAEVGPEVLWRRLEDGEADFSVGYRRLFGSEEQYVELRVIRLPHNDSKVILAARNVTGEMREQLSQKVALQNALDLAEHASQAKSTFLTNMSHDIRTPMNSIMGLTAIASMYLDDPERVKDCLTKITTSSRHLLGLINEVLDMAKIESGNLGLSEEDFDLPETVESLMSIMTPQINDKKLNLKAEIADIQHEHVVGDPMRLQQVFVNIMGNSVKFTPEGGTVSLRIKELPSRVKGSGCYEFTFSDTGCGMSEEFVQKVFEPFTRANDSRVTKVEGTGLGMSIVRSVVNLMNGTIDVKSKLGEGTTFTVTVYMKLRDGDDQDLTPLEGLRVLVADDEQTAAESACEVLKSIGMEPDYVLSGDDAVEAVRHSVEDERSYVAVILDWKMPGKSGIEAAREIREIVSDDMPIIILSAYDWTAVEQEARSVGVDAFIAKPLFKSRLVHVMKGLLASDEEEGEPASEYEVLQQSDFSGHRVLLTEDNSIAAAIAMDIMGMTGLEVDHAENGRIAVEKLLDAEPGHYDLVFMDIQMPVMNGYEAAKAIRATAEGQGPDGEAIDARADLGEIPIVALTADAFADDVARARAAGMNAHMSKPMEIELLVKTLKEWL